MNAPAFATGTLAWVKDEIDLALERAGAALARHAAAPDDVRPLESARSHVHQACGALTLVGLKGVSVLAAAVETRLAALAAPTHEENGVAVSAAAGAALAALRRYLDDLMAGHPDQPLRLYPAHRALALAAGLPEPAPQGLFYPDLTLRPPRREDAATPLTPVRLKALRLGFSRGLTKWQRGEARGLAEMRTAIAALEHHCTQPARRALWWVALAWFDQRMDVPAPGPDTPVPAALEQQIEAFLTGQQPADALPEALMSELLYDIARAAPGGTHLDSVRAAYRLADLIPRTHLHEETRREACRAPLTTAMVEWERFSRGAAIALMHFHDVALLLEASATDSHDDELTRLAGAIVAFAAWLRQQPERTHAAMFIEVAGALVLFEDAIEQEGVRNPVDAPLFTAEVTAQIDRLEALRQAGITAAPPLAHTHWRTHRLIGQVAHEIGNNLAAIEAVLEHYFQAPDAAVSLTTVQQQLHQVTGAFRLLDESAAARMAAAVEARLEAIRQGMHPPGEFAAIADPLATLAQFADSLAHGRPERALLDDGDGLLAIFTEEAREVLATLASIQPVLAAHPADRAALMTLRRSFHTLKGSSRMVGLTGLGEAASAVERLLNEWLDARTPLHADQLDFLADAHTLFAAWTTALEQHRPAPDPAALLNRCAALSGKEGPMAAVPPPSTFTPVDPAPATAHVTVGDRAISAALYSLYIDEARGHLATLRKELTHASSPPSHALIRAAHTLAGISAGTGFASVQTLAHALEGALVRHSLAHAAPEEAGRMLLARAFGALEGMVGAIAERRAPASEPALSAALEALQASTASPPADTIDPALAALFLEEAEEQLHQLDADLRAWRAAPQQADIGQRMVRLLHTFKGGARLCGAMRIGELAHGMETRIGQALAAGDASPAVLDSLEHSLDRVNQHIAALRRPVAVAPAVTTTMVTAATATEAAPAAMLRVRADLIDHLVNEAGEMAIARSRIEGSLKAFKGALFDLADNVARLRGQLREFEIHAESRMQSQLGGMNPQQRDFDPLEFDRFTRLQELTRMMAESVNDVATVQHALLYQSHAAGEAVAAQSRQNRELAHALLRARMVPFSTVVERLRRVVRQTAQELGRQAHLDIHGSDTPIDRIVLERMLGPLEHLLRNAVVHGIEPAADRRAAGKPEAGQITLTLVPADNDITLTLIDDGCGLDLAAIHRRAVEGGLLAAEATVSDAELAELIFHPGFSTVATVSEIAGRGVGLDVVRSEVVQLGGRVAVTPAAADTGQGARFEVVLPLTLAVIPVMLVRAAGQSWAIPAAMVEAAHELEATEAAARRAAGGLTRAGRRYPWCSLPQLFGLPPDTGPSGWQLLLRSGGEQLALEVETLAQNLEVVVKPVGEQLARVPGLTGATVLPDGTVALIVNPLLLARRPLPVVAARPVVAPVPTILVVDDSLTVRKITGRLLERAGYRVLTARDGVAALEQLAQETPAVILADIEMPRMDGFELLRTLRADPRHAGLPVIMITSRIAAKHRQRARELGVQHYLGKPYDEGELLGLIAALVRQP